VARCAVSWRFIFLSIKHFFLFIVENTVASSGKKGSKKAPAYAYYAHTGYDAPGVIICSAAEMDSATPSVELQAFKNMGVSCNCNFIIFIITNDLL
jgi:hypothetical protein